MVLGVEQIVLDALPGQELAQQLVFLDGNRTHQHRLALFVALLDLPDDGTVFAVFGLIHRILIVNTDHGAIGGDLHDVQLVDGGEFLLLCQGRTGHTGELIIQTEIILEGDGGQGLALPLDGHMLLGLDGLVQALGVAAAEHQTAREFVHDDDFPVLDHIVHIPLHGAVGLDSLVDVVGDGAVFGVGQILQAEELLGLGDAPGGEGGGFGLFIHHIVRVDGGVLLGLVIGFGDYIFFEAGGKLLGLVIKLSGFFPHAGNDKGSAGFIDKDGVHLVHDSEVVAPLDLLAGVEGHVVAQVVKAHLVVGAVGDVGGVGGLAFGLGQIMDDKAHGKAQEAVDLAHPLRVALGQIVVDGDDVDALAGEGVEVGGEGGHQGFTFTGLHLGDAALVQHNAADELHPVGTQAQHPVRCLPDGGKGLGENIVGSLAILQTLLELGGFCLKLGVSEGFILLLQRLDLIGDGIDLFQLVVTVCTENLGQQAHI